MDYFPTQMIGGGGSGGGVSVDFEDIGRFTGFSEAGDLSGAVLTYTDSPREFQITPAQTSFNYYIRGKKYTVESQMTVSWADTSGLHVIYFDGPSLVSQPIGEVTVRLFKDVALVAYVLWDAILGRVIKFGGERHGSNASEDLHGYLHNVNGTQYAGGLKPVVNGTDVNTVAPKMIVGAGVLYDEDIRLNIPARGVNPDSSPAQIPIFYKEGAFDDFVWRAKAPDQYCVIGQGSMDYAGNFINFFAEYPLVNRLVTGGGTQDLKLDGMTTAAYSQVYSESTKFGTISNRVYTESASFLMYRFDAGGGIFYVAAYNTDLDAYVVVRTTTDPNLWATGQTYVMNQSETITSLLEIYLTKIRPSSSSPLVTYIISGGTTEWGLYETQPGAIYLMHLFGDNHVNETGNFGNVSFICGENIYPDINTATEAAPFEIADLVTEGLPLAEFRAIGSFIIEVTSETLNPVRALFRTDSEGNTFQDFRATKTRSIGGAAASIHNQLAGLQGGTSNEHYHFTQAQHAALLALI